MNSDIILKDNSVEVKGRLNANDGMDTTVISASSLNISGQGHITILKRNSRNQVFQVTDRGTAFIGSDQNRGFLRVKGPEGSSYLTSSRCEAEELIGNQHISAGKPKSTQEGARQGIDGRVSIYNADSEDAQVEIQGKTGDIRMAGSITPTAESPIMYVYEQEASNSQEQDSSSRAVLEENNSQRFRNPIWQRFRHPRQIPKLDLNPVQLRKSRTIIAYSQNQKNTGLIYSAIGNFVFQNAGEAVLSVNLGQKKIGIGTDSPSHALHVNGTVAATEPFRNLSDGRCKDIKGEIDDALVKIQNLRGVRFRWNSDCDSQNTDEREHLGVIAQEVEVVLPEVVSEGEEGTKTVSYSEIIPVLIEALKDEAQERLNLEERLKALESKVAQLLNTTTVT